MLAAPSPRAAPPRARAARRPPDWRPRARAARRRRGAVRASARRSPRAADRTRRAARARSPASRAGRPRRCGQHPAPLAILERAAGILEPAGQRRRVLRRHRRQRVPLHLQLGDAIGAPSAPESARSPGRWRGDRPARARRLARAPLRPRVPAAARRSPRAPPRSRRSNCCASAASSSTSACSSAHARRTSRQRAARLRPDRRPRPALPRGAADRAPARRSSALIVHGRCRRRRLRRLLDLAQLGARAARRPPCCGRAARSPPSASRRVDRARAPRRPRRCAPT